MVRAEHRGAIPGIVHGASASGASLFLEPLGTVEINNDIVELEEQEAEEVRRILLALTDAFRARPDDLERTVEVATELDVDPGEGALLADDRRRRAGDLHPTARFELAGARHHCSCCVSAARANVPSRDAGRHAADAADARPGHRRARTPAARRWRSRPRGSSPRWRRPACTSRRRRGRGCRSSGRIFADIGDEQSICGQPEHVLGAHHQRRVDGPRPRRCRRWSCSTKWAPGTDPVEGGALGTAVIDHFRKRGAHLMATTHYDALKSYASTTEGVVERRVRLRPGDVRADLPARSTDRPGAAWRSRLRRASACRPAVIAAARGNLTERETQLAGTPRARGPRAARARAGAARGRRRSALALAESERKLRAREASLRENGGRAARGGSTRRWTTSCARRAREIDAVIEGLKARATVLRDKSGAARRRRAIEHRRDRGGAGRGARRARRGDRASVQDGAGAQPPRRTPAQPAEPGRARRRRPRRGGRRSASRAWCSSCTASTPRSTCAASACARRARPARDRRRPPPGGPTRQRRSAAARRARCRS